jgi:ATP-binding cassette, subfamily G (WHITE), member 2
VFLSTRRVARVAVRRESASDVSPAAPRAMQMGPSGSGKTTLLDVLAGRKTQGQATGEILFSAHAPSVNFLRRFTGYVEQFDTLLDILTVREMLLYTAEMKRPVAEPLAKKEAVVDHLIDVLGLDSCKDTRIGNALNRYVSREPYKHTDAALRCRSTGSANHTVRRVRVAPAETRRRDSTCGAVPHCAPSPRQCSRRHACSGISGGQAKRTNVALAMVVNPRVLFLDEPTSGLDSYTANEVMTVVKALVAENVTICATIHSPSPYTFSLFDRLLVLVAGECVYHGPNGSEMVEYFKHGCGVPPPSSALQATDISNDADFLTDLVVGADRARRSGEYAAAYAKSAVRAGMMDIVYRNAKVRAGRP